MLKGSLTPELEKKFKHKSTLLEELIQKTVSAPRGSSSGLAANDEDLMTAYCAGPGFSGQRPVSTKNATSSFCALTASAPASLKTNSESS